MWFPVSPPFIQHNKQWLSSTSLDTRCFARCRGYKDNWDIIPALNRLTVAQSLSTIPGLFPAETHHLVSVSFLCQCSLSCLKCPFLLFLCLSRLRHKLLRKVFLNCQTGFPYHMHTFLSHKSRLSVYKTISSSGFSVPSNLWFSKIKDYAWS